MTYLIPAVLLILIIVLVILFRSAKKKQKMEAASPAGPIARGTVEETVPHPVREAAEAELREKPAGPETGEADEEPAAGSEAERRSVPAGEEFVELSFDSDESVAVEEQPEEEEFVELSLDMEEPAVAAEEAATDAEGAEEDAPLAPALADSMEESAITVEEAPEELTEKLDYYFSDEEEIPAPHGEEGLAVEEEAGEEEILLDELLAEPEVPAEEFPEEAGEPEAPARLTRDVYDAGLRSLEVKLRQELQEAIQQKDAERRRVLESKLQAACEKLAAGEESFHRHEQLIEAASRVLDEVQDAARQHELPGINLEEAGKQLQKDNSEQVEAILAEASLQLDQESALPARVYYLCGQLAENRLDYESAFEDYRNAAAAEDENEAYLLAAGRMAGILGNNREAHPWLEKVVRQGLEKGEQTLLQASAQHELARICVREGQKEKAAALFKRALEIREKMQGDGHPDLGPLMHDYAALFESNGMYEEAEALYTGALSVMEKNLGGSHPRLGTTLNRLAGLYEELERGEKALPLYEKALAIKEQVLGEEHYEVATILNSLADLLRRQGRLEQAEPMFKRSLAIAEKELGKDHPNLTVVLNNLAELYSQMGREEEAAGYQERAFSLFELPGMEGDFVEMEKDQVAIDDDKDTTVAGK